MRKPMKMGPKRGRSPSAGQDVNDTKARGLHKEKVPAKTKNNVKALAMMGKKKKSA